MEKQKWPCVYLLLSMKVVVIYQAVIYPNTVKYSESFVLFLMSFHSVDGC